MKNTMKHRGAAPKFSKEDVETILSFLTKNDSIKDIANLYNASEMTVTQVLKAQGAYNYLKGTEAHEAMKLARKEAGVKNKVQLDDEMIKKIRNLLANKYTLMKACRYLKIDYQHTYLQWKKLEGDEAIQTRKFVPIVKTNNLELVNELILQGYQLFNTHTLHDEVHYILKKEVDAKSINTTRPEGQYGPNY